MNLLGQDCPSHPLKVKLTFMIMGILKSTELSSIPKCFNVEFFTCTVQLFII